MMQEPQHPIQQRLADKLKERAALLRRLEVLDTEIKTWEEAWALVTKPMSAAPVARHPVASDTESKRERALQPQWADMLRMVGGQEAATLDDMEAYSDLMGYGIKRNTLRSQVSIYASHGWLDRIAQGKFRLTDLGAAKCGFVKKDEAPSGVAAGASGAVEG